MALLTKADGSARAALAAHGLVGRSSACSLRVDDPLASAEHARLSFGDGVWSVRDLGSRNGTWLNGARLEPGGTRQLSAGDRLAFGNLGAAWTLTDASPPVAMARRLADEAMMAAVDGMLALPSADAPLACVCEGTGGAWIAEVEGEARPALDGEVIRVAGEPFMLHLPVTQPTTVDAAAAARPMLDEIDLSLRVSRDEEHVEVAVAAPGGARVLPPRAHHYTLLTLARARVRDERALTLAEQQRGWLFVDDLCRSLSMEEGRLNVDIYRIRQDFAALGLANATGVVERRRGSRQLRLGTSRLAIEVMG